MCEIFLAKMSTLEKVSYAQGPETTDIVVHRVSTPHHSHPTLEQVGGLKSPRLSPLDSMMDPAHP